MPKPIKPTLELAVAGQKAKASTYNENFETMLDYVDECMDYSLTADLSNLESVSENGENVLKTKFLQNTTKGSDTVPVYVADGVTKAINVTNFFNSVANTFGTITEKSGSATSSSGYVKFNNGLLIQWGTFAKNVNYTEVSLLKNYSGTTYCVVTAPNTDANDRVDTGGLTYSAWMFPAYSKSVNKFRVKALSTGQWIAIGY